jgi:hypothetical protein
MSMMHCLRKRKVSVMNDELKKVTEAETETQD